MKINYGKIIVSLSTIPILAMLTLAGCSDNDRDTSSSHSIPDNSKIVILTKNIDVDNCKIPDIFEDKIDSTSDFELNVLNSVRYHSPNTSNKHINAKNGAQQLFGITHNGEEVNKNDFVNSAPTTISSYVLPSYIERYQDEGDPKNDNLDQVQIVHPDDINKIELEKGTTYTVSLQHSQNSGAYIGDFNPDIRIIAQDDYLSNPEAEGLSLTPIDIGDNERCISLSFTPQNSGVYLIVVKNLSTIEDDPENIDTSKIKEYTVSIYPDQDKYGHSTKFGTNIGGEIALYTPAQIQELRAALAPYAVYDEETGVITGISDKVVNGLTAQERYEQTLARLNTQLSSDYKNLATSSENADKALSTNGRTIIDPTQNGFYWDESTFMGDGLSAVTGMPPVRQSGAVKDFESSLPKGSSYTTNTKILLVDNETSHQEAIGIDTTASVSGPRAALSVENKYSKNIKYGSNTTTFMITYNYAENSPRRLSNLKSYELSDDAAKFLAKNGEDAFRKEYGDYFIGGATYGARYMGTVVIKANSNEEITEVKNKINTTIMSTAKIDSEFTKSIQDATKNCQIELTEITIGESYDTSTDDSVTGTNALATLTRHYQSFKDHAEDNNREHRFDKLTSYLIGFNQIKGGESLSNSVNVELDAFTDIRKICGMLMSTRSMVKAYTLQPDEHFANGAVHKKDIEVNFDNLSTQVTNNIDAMVADSKVRQQWLNTVQTERDIAVDRMGRYDLFRSLENAAANMKNKGLSYGSYGFEHYYKFPAANSDIDKNDSGEYNIKYKIGWRHWDPTFTVDGNHRFCFFQLNKTSSQGSTTGADLSWDGNSNPALSRRSMTLHVESGYDRGLWLSYKWSALNDTNYKDFAWTY